MSGRGRSPRRDYGSIRRTQSARSTRSLIMQPSYLDVNKEKYGDFRQRAWEEKLMNRYSRPPIKRLTLLRNGEKDTKPKQYIWREKLLPTLDHLKKELQRIVPPIEGDKVQMIYEENGRPIEHAEEIYDGGVYVVAGNAQFEHPMQMNDEWPEPIDSGYSGSERGQSRTRSRPTNNNYSRSASRRGTQTHREPWKNLNPDDKIDWEQIERKDMEVIENHKRKQQNQGLRLPPIEQRTAQSNPGAFIVYVFRNGHGYDRRQVTFTEKQLDRGLNWVMEIMAKGFGINPKKLFTMDGRALRSSYDVQPNGAYVLASLGEQFKDTWYYLPDKAVDTTGQKPQRRRSNTGRPQTQPRARSYDGERRSEGTRKASHVPAPRYNNAYRLRSAAASRNRPRPVTRSYSLAGRKNSTSPSRSRGRNTNRNSRPK